MKKIEKNIKGQLNLMLKNKGRKNLEKLNIAMVKIVMKKAILLDEINILTKDIINYLKNMVIKILKLST